jgi:hypothetical protein
MSSTLVRLPRLLLLFAAMLLAGTVQLAGPVVSGADVRVSALVVEPGVRGMRSDIPKQQMTQFRCPGGQLVFLTRACGCNGACCACAPNVRYLNHCTCRCEAVPTACTKGHSAGNP